MNVACRDFVVRWCIFLQTLQRSGHSKVPPNCPVSLFIRVFVFHDRCMKGQRRSTHWGEFLWAHHPPPINSLKKDSWGIESYLACSLAWACWVWCWLEAGCSLFYCAREICFLTDQHKFEEQGVNYIFPYPCSRHFAEPLSMKWALRRHWKVQQLV